MYRLFISKIVCHHLKKVENHCPNTSAIQPAIIWKMIQLENLQGIESFIEFPTRTDANPVVL